MTRSMVVVGPDVRLRYLLNNGTFSEQVGGPGGAAIDAAQALGYAITRDRRAEELHRSTRCEVAGPALPPTLRLTQGEQLRFDLRFFESLGYSAPRVPDIELVVASGDPAYLWMTDDELQLGRVMKAISAVNGRAAWDVALTLRPEMLASYGAAFEVVGVGEANMPRLATAQDNDLITLWKDSGCAQLLAFQESNRSMASVSEHGIERVSLDHDRPWLRHAYVAAALVARLEATEEWQSKVAEVRDVIPQLRGSLWSSF